MATHENVRGRGVRLYGSAVAALTAAAAVAAPTFAEESPTVSVSMSKSDQRIVYGEKVAVAGRVSSGEEGREVALQYARRGRSFRTVKRTTTRADGRYRLAIRPIRSGALRVVTGEASASSSSTAGGSTSGQRRVTVAGKLHARARKHVKRGRAARVSGRLKPGFKGRRIWIQIRKKGRWVTVERVRTRRRGRFAASWRMQRPAGRHKVRAIFGGDRRNARTKRVRRINVYRPGQASYYGPGLYGNRTACGQRLTPGTLGVANRWLPCGTRVTFRYRGRTVTVPVIDRGPFHASRIWDLTYATKRKLGFGSTGTVWATR